jgi:phosphinothricin acetyltransferase
VEKTAITFEYEVPSTEEFRQRIRETLRRYPYLAAVTDGRIVGYAYAGVFKGRRAYDWAVETTVYIREDRKGQGIGRLLYEALEEQLRRQNIQNMYACIAAAEEEDAYLTADSPRFHEHMGFTLVGTFHKCGYKFGKWYDMIWMEKMLGEHEECPAEIQPPTENSCYNNI